MFATWFADARKSVRPLPHAMALATTGPGGRASVRMVLMKNFDAAGFVFYTNYRSRKARDLARNARASLLFYWGALERQVRIEGRVAKVARRESDEYFATRSRGSQLGAWASPQSETIVDRAALARRCAAAAARYRGRGAAPAALGRLPARTRGDRVLAGTRGQAARSHPLPPHARGPVGARAARALNAPVTTTAAPVTGESANPYARAALNVLSRLAVPAALLAGAFLVVYLGDTLPLSRRSAYLTPISRWWAGLRLRSCSAGAAPCSPFSPWPSPTPRSRPGSRRG